MTTMFFPRQLHALATIVLFGAAIHGCGSNSNGTQNTKNPPVPVTVVTAERRNVLVQVPAIGSVEPSSTVAITPQIDGQLAQVHFKEGQWVKQGDLLFSIDARPFEAALQQAQANQRRDTAELANAAVDATRKARLAAQGFVSAEENDAAQTRAASLRAAVKAGEAAIDDAKLQLQYCFIRSPTDGRVGRLLIDAGNIVKRNETTLAVVNQVRPVHVAFSVRERDLVEVRQRQESAPLPVEVLSDDSAAEPVRGHLAFVDNAVDSSTGTVLLKALFPNADERLWPGQFVDVRLTLREESDALVVPASAVLTGQQGKYVFVVGPDSTVQVQPVTVGLDLAHEEVIVTTGLSGGEQVVVDGQIRLTAGSKIDIRKAVAGADAPLPRHE